MNKTEMTSAIAQASGVSKKDSEKVLNAIVEIMTQELAKGERVQLSGFGIFEVRDREARTGRNPITGETVQIPATKVPAFKASKNLKDRIKG